MSTLDKNLHKSKLQEKVDILQSLVNTAIKYNAENKSILISDLIRAKEKLANS